MDELIIKEIIWDRVKVIIGIGVFIICVFFIVNGIFNTGWRIPELRVEIAELTDSRDTWQTRAKELDKYIETREGEYRVACKFDKLFMLVASPSQVLDFEALEEYIKSKKEFFKPVKMKKGIVKKGE